jgi:D-alanyl-lipoteichoic acid acyltransferase DltB (MBOAT superfamily)
LSYSIDVYRKKIEPTKDIVAFFAFVSFFPQLVAGPIERATNLLPQFYTSRKFDYDTAVDGMRQILWGLFKKIVVADNCAIYVNVVFADYTNQSGSTLLLGAIFFAFQIYGDFSGYSDIAIGTAKLFGIKLLRNFNVPYFSRDIAEFWRRWHISLNTWFVDYLYIPLGGSRPYVSPNSKYPELTKKAKVIRNTFAIFLTSGLWHGANWTFVAWGAYHALLFIPLILLGKNKRFTDTVATGKILPSIREVFQILTTFILVVIGWVFFRAETISQAFEYLGGIFNSSLVSVPYLINRDYYVITFVGIIIMLFTEWVYRHHSHNFTLSQIKFAWVKWVIYFIMLFLLFINSSPAADFIYFQF